MNQEDIERRFDSALKQAGLLKEAEVEEKSSADATPVPAPTVINLFQHPDAHPYVLDLALLRQYGPEWFEWEPDTLRHQVPLDFRTQSLSDLNMQKLQAVKTLHYVDTYWNSWEVFLPCTMALNGLYPDFGVMNVPTVAQCAISVDTANRVRENVRWGDEVKEYLAVVHKHDSVLCAIDPLDFVELDLEGYPVDCEEVSRLWPDVRRSGKAPSGDTTTDEQLRRLLIVHGALKENQAQLRAQLPLLLHA